MKQKAGMQPYKKMSGTQTKNPQQTHSPHEKDVDIADKNANEDEVCQMERGVTNVARSTIFKDV